VLSTFTSPAQHVGFLGNSQPSEKLEASAASLPSGSSAPEVTFAVNLQGHLLADHSLH
jgi:hypothetical protein